MNGNTTKGGLTKTRKAKTIKVAPATRAIRLALATSATMLALAGSGVTFAGTCLPTGATETTCVGIFTDTVNAGDEFPGVIDLTLILDDSVVITTAAGDVGAYASWDGDVTVTNYGVISVDDASAIEVNAYNGNGTVNNYGIVESDAVGADVTTVYVSAYDGAYVNNSGIIIAGADPGTSYDATGVYATGKYTDVTNAAGGEIFVGAYNGDATGIVSYATGFGKYAGVTNDGDITVGSFGGDAIGIIAQGEYAGVNNNGNIEATSQGGDAIGIIAVATYYGVNVANTGNIEVEAPNAAVGVYAVGADYASVDNSGDISAVSTNKYAVGVVAIGDYASVDNSGSITALGYDGAAGIIAYGTYGVDVSNTGSIDVAVMNEQSESLQISVGSGSEHAELLEIAVTAPQNVLASEPAPSTASSRGEQLEARRSRQVELGAKWSALDGRLLVVRGRPEERIPMIAKEIDASAVHVSADFTPFGRRRDERVQEALGGIPLVATGSPYLVSPGRVTKDDDTPYRVFTPFFRRWRDHGWRQPARTGSPSAQWIDPGGVITPATARAASMFLALTSMKMRSCGARS